MKDITNPERPVKELLLYFVYIITRNISLVFIILRILVTHMFLKNNYTLTKHLPLHVSPSFQFRKCTEKPNSTWSSLSSFKFSSK